MAVFGNNGRMDPISLRRMQELPNDKAPRNYIECLVGLDPNKHFHAPLLHEQVKTADELEELRKKYHKALDGVFDNCKLMLDSDV